MCHRDLKPANILCSEDGEIVKITDFNISKFCDDTNKKYSFSKNIKMFTYTGTIAYNAPELFVFGDYNESVDMWSAGGN